MTEAMLGRSMFQRALDFLNRRFPTGWGGCAVMRTADDQFLISVALESFNASAGLCMETGAMCEAQKYNLKITHSLCLSRESEEEEPVILTACGICRERLRYWGEDVLVGVTMEDNSLKFVRLGDLMPYYWGKAYNHGTD